MALRSGLVSSPQDTDLSATTSNGFAAHLLSSTATTPTSEDATPAHSADNTPRGQMHVPPGVPVDVRDKHKRSYQACNECRARKIKCDQGPVDNPIPPPCARCRRENRPCTFSATRRKNPKKRKVQEEEEESADEDDSDKKEGNAPNSEEEDPVTVLQQHETMSGLDSLNILGLAAARISAATASSDTHYKSLSQIAAWERLSFVRRELFSAQEAIGYINYFFNFLYPFTPILLPDYQNNQIELLEKEPVLLVVILTIASRYKRLSGLGADYRQSTIHEHLWSYLKRMIEKTLWAQEKFSPSKNLRSYGTVEGLLLLAEWNPRALHSPLSDEDELVAPEVRPKRRRSDAPPTYLPHRTNELHEPCWRSDRMSWMLLSHAIGIAFELGVFDPTNENPRAKYLRTLLPIYLIQLAGRLDLIGSLPTNYLESFNSGELNLEDITTSNEPKVMSIYFWKRLTDLIKAGNQEMFAHREKTRELIKSRQYTFLLDNRFHPLLNQWLAEFEQSNSVPPFIAAVLRIEYEYTRVYINSLALQAIVDRCANSSPVQRHVATVGRKASGSSKAIPLHLFDKCIGEDRKYLEEITDGCKTVLKIVLDLGPNLKHLSVRTYFRIIAVTVILLKTFALGAKENNILLSIERVKALIAAVKKYVVDDIHIGNRFAHTVEALLERTTQRLVRFNFPQSNSNGKAEISIPSSPAFNHIPTTADPSSIFQAQSLPFSMESAYDPNSAMMLPPGMSDINMQQNGDLFNPELMNAGSGSDWITLPLDTLFSFENGPEISTSGFGPDVNGYDMLDVLLKGNSPN